MKPKRLMILALAMLGWPAVAQAQDCSFGDPIVTTGYMSSWGALITTRGLNSPWGDATIPDTINDEFSNRGLGWSWHSIPDLTHIEYDIQPTPGLKMFFFLARPKNKTGNSTNSFRCLQFSTFTISSLPLEKEIGNRHTQTEGSSLIGNRQTQTEGSSLGVLNNEFWFEITGATNNPMVVEACTNLAKPDWIFLQSCTLTNGLIRFNDPQWTNYPSRFYRIRSP